MNRKLSGGQDEKPGRLMGCHHTQRNFGLALFVRVPSLDKPAISLRLPSHLPSEYTAIHYRNLWAYSERMPLIPVARIGLIPMLQWIILPTIILRLLSWFEIILPKHKEIDA